MRTMLRRGALHAAALLATVLLALAACSVAPVELPLKPGQANEERRTVDYRPDRPMIILSYSGGGSRATALAAAVTARLDRIAYETPSGPRRLSQDVALVSSVSGGSVFAAWVGLYGFDHDKIVTFERKIGTFDGIGYLTGRAANPFTWADLAVTRRTRIDVLQDMLRRFLETDATMATLNQKGKPLVVLNASDMTAGEVFSFTPGTLDDMCLSFDEMPVAVAVSASAAVPVAFSPVLLKDSAWFGCEGQRRPPGDWRTPLVVDGGAYANIEAFRTARYRASLRADKLAYRDHHYVRLLDGGLADNLGLTAARRVLMDPDSPAYVYDALGTGRVRRVVVISVNARSDRPDALDKSNERTTIPRDDRRGDQRADRRHDGECRGGVSRLRRQPDERSRHAAAQRPAGALHPLSRGDRFRRAADRDAAADRRSRHGEGDRHVVDDLARRGRADRQDRRRAVVAPPLLQRAGRRPQGERRARGRGAGRHTLSSAMRGTGTSGVSIAPPSPAARPRPSLSGRSGGSSRNRRRGSSW
jgi:NTE family protein